MKKTYQDVLARHRKSKFKLSIVELQSVRSSGSHVCISSVRFGVVHSIPRGQRTLLLREKRLWQYYRGLIQLQNDPEDI